ncbi:MAG: thiamine pyrophosphate-binding protein [Rhodospirillaceae bacterium]|nr:thiamine pyrophosphate-binding protein [Rhodospirillaceae bacterium]MBT5513367.1 thiamine pyrophosphate-binding protein [Rhodospirillaceae bacterium]MBT6087618.1 thiamine pyrophosphate-binding protein [Rhodospirillaceae bacterium]MBT6608657.1 thiamine pyrophosphate-binding protein [Rhodospirillaceae bacterium]MBT6886255.1 thiamine pyrophosphate-binding protein [Rhodospirillaceae bacterium]
MPDAGSNQLNGAEAMVRMLEAHGAKHIFGLCGDTTLPFYDALQRLNHGMTHILTRDERHAGYMADAYARVTHKPGICEGPSGGGATYILPGLVEAGESSVPVLGITSDVSVASNGHYPLTELSQKDLFRPLTKYNNVINLAGELPSMVRAAFRAMTTGRPGSAHLALPYDVQTAPVTESEIWAQSDFETYPAWPAAPSDDAVDGFVKALTAAKNPLIICGGGVVLAGGEAELQRLAEGLNIAVATTVSGQGSLSDLHPNCLGVVGSNGGVVETRAVVEEADLIIFVGCRAGSVTTERWRFPAMGSKIAHIDSDPMAVSANYHTDIPLIGDARLTLAAINVALEADGVDGVDFGGATRITKARETKFAAFEELSTSNETPIRPERLIADLNDVLPDDAVLIADPGTPCPYISAYYRVDRPGRHFISNRAHGALGYSLSAAIGAQIGRPDAKIVAMMGDGSFGMAVGEFETVTRLGLPITYIVVSNSVYGWIKAGQKSGFDERYFSVDFNRTDHAAVAEAFGIKSWTVDDPGQLKFVLAEAVKHDGPTLVDVITQPLQDARAPVSEWVA